MMLCKPAAALRSNHYAKASRGRSVALKAVMAPAASDIGYDQSSGGFAVSRLSVGFPEHCSSSPSSSTLGPYWQLFLAGSWQTDTTPMSITTLYIQKSFQKPSSPGTC
jgi:hypothetical protein